MKRYTLLILSLLLIKLAFAQDFTVTYNVTREAYPTALAAEGASVTIFNATYCNPAQTLLVNAAGTVSFTIQKPAGVAVPLTETITLAGHNTKTGIQNVSASATSPYNAYKYLGLTNTNLVVQLTKDVATTGTPLSGIDIVFTCTTPAINTTLVTDATGKVTLPVTRDAAVNYTITITPNASQLSGYATIPAQTQVIAFAPSSNMTTKTIAALWNYTLNFAVTDQSTVPIVGASITCTGTPTSVAKLTDAGGLTNFTKQRGSVNYTVTATGFADSTANIAATTFISDPINIAPIKLKSAYNIDFTIVDELAAPITGALITLKGNYATPGTGTTTASGTYSFLKKIEGTYTYIITKTGYADKTGTLTLSGTNSTQNITLSAGYNFTFTVKKGTTNLLNDSVTVNGLTKLTNASGVVVFGLPAGTHNYTNKKYAYIDEAGTINVDAVTPANNLLTLTLTPIYSIRFRTRNETSTIVSGATILFDGKSYLTDANGYVYVYNVSPSDAFRTIKIMKDGYASFTDSVRLTTAAVTFFGSSINPGNYNRINIDDNYFAFTKPRIDINYSPSMNYVKLLVNGVDQSSAISFMGAGSIYNVNPGVYNYYMTYNTAGFAPARGKVEVTADKNAKILVNFAAGYDIEVYALDTQDNQIEGAYVTLDDSLNRTDASGLALYKARVPGNYPYTVYQKDGSGNIIAKAKGEFTHGTATSTKVIKLSTITNSIKVNVYDTHNGVEFQGATVTCDNQTYTTDAMGAATIPISANGEYSYTVSYSGYFDYTSKVTITDANAEEWVYLNKKFSASFTINDGTNPIAGAVVKINGMDGVTNATGQLTFAESFKNWESVEYTASAIGYSDITGTFNVEKADVVVPTISFTSLAYDANLRVLNSAGYPISGALITIDNKQYTSNTLGYVNAFKLLNGTYPVVISKAGFVDNSNSITIADATLNQNITMVGGYDLTIQVVNGPTGTVGLANDEITLNGVTKITDASGMVVFGVPMNSAVHIVNSRAGFVDGTLDIADVNANMSHTIYMTPIYLVTFRAMDANTYNPIQGATVTFNGNDLLTDVDGFAIFNNIAPSASAFSYTIKGNGTYGSETGTLDLPFTSTDEYLASDNNVTVNSYLSSPGVYFSVSQGMMSYYGATTITFDGVDYNLDPIMGGILINCAVGTHTWVATPADVTKAIYHGSVTVPASPTEFVAIDVQDGHKVEIYTKDKSDNAIVGAAVTFNGSTVNTDESGAAVYNRVPQAEYTYSITKTGYVDVIDVALSVNTADVLEVVTLLKPSYAVTVTVTDGTNPISGANVTFDGVSANTDASGVLIITDKIAGNYNYTVSQTGYNDATGNVTVVDIDVAENVTLVLTTYAVTFNVKKGANAIVDAAVVLDGTTVNTDASGVANFTSKIPGTYAYTINKSGFDQVTGNITITNADVTENVNLLGTGIEGFSSIIKNPYPNPTSGLLNVTIPDKAVNSEIKVVNGLGNVVKTINAKNSAGSIQAIDLGSLPDGNYFIILRSNEEQKVWQVVKKQ